MPMFFLECTKQYQAQRGLHEKQRYTDTYHNAKERFQALHTFALELSDNKYFTSEDGN